MGKRWTDAEKDFLQENWEKGAKFCAKELKRSVATVRTQASVLGLGRSLQASGCLTTGEVAEIMGVHITTVRNWIKGGFLRVGKKKRIDKRFYAIELNDLFKFLERHQHLWNSRKMTDSFWVTEPDWMIQKRKDDRNRARKEDQAWTVEEDKRLVALYKSGRYTMEELTEHLGRSKSSIYGRLSRLDVWGTGRYVGYKKQQRRA